MHIVKEYEAFKETEYDFPKFDKSSLDLNP